MPPRHHSLRLSRGSVTMRRSRLCRIRRPARTACAGRRDRATYCPPIGGQSSSPLRLMKSVTAGPIIVAMLQCDDVGSLILVYVEDHPVCNLVVDTAADIARRLATGLILVHAFTVTQPSWECDVLGKEAYLVRGSTPAEDLTRGFAERAALAGITDCTRVVRRGSPLAVIEKVAGETRPALIVTADTQDGSKPRWWGTFGREAERRTRCPVVTVSPAARMTMYSAHSAGLGDIGCALSIPNRGTSRFIPRLLDFRTAQRRSAIR
ncbi:universal stress protein [Nocardia sp. NPDC101769]|uniref:universal stress protein n=1 Tax=Nocardia sp. NPDC101769 TaxID=3364333 RepID=UPI00382994ED